MSNWLKKLNYDPINPLLESNNQVIVYFTNRDLLNKKVESIEKIWNLKEVENILKKQVTDGSFKFSGKKPNIFPPYHYGLVETFKQIRFLIQKYEMNKNHPSISKASEFIFSCQSKDGDIRGMIGNQYATYYTGAILYLLIKAGYENDERTIKGLEWLLTYRQKDGAWTIPILTSNYSWNDLCRLTSTNVEPVEPDKSMPFSHNWTGMVLRAFAEHHKYCNLEEIKTAAFLYKSRFLKKMFILHIKMQIIG